MGLFDLFAKKKSGAPKVSQRELLRLERLVGNKLSQNIDRQESIRTLCGMGTRESAAILLKRFNWMLDPSITDQEEKESCVAGIVAAGNAALEPIRSYTKRAESLMWPIKALKQILSGEALTEELLSMLDQFDTEYVRNVEPKVQLITELADHPTPDVRVALLPFLQDASEPVRFQTTTSLFAIGDAESTAGLVSALEGEESRRVKNRITQGLSERGWPIPEALREACARSLPDGFRLDGDRLVSA